MSLKTPLCRNIFLCTDSMGHGWCIATWCKNHWNRMYSRCTVLIEITTLTYSPSLLPAARHHFSMYPPRKSNAQVSRCINVAEGLQETRNFCCTSQHFRKFRAVFFESRFRITLPMISFVAHRRTFGTPESPRQAFAFRKLRICTHFVARRSFRITGNLFGFPESIICCRVLEFRQELR